MIVCVGRRFLLFSAGRAVIVLCALVRLHTELEVGRGQREYAAHIELGTL